MDGVGLVGQAIVCEAAEKEAKWIAGGAGVKFATSERFKFTGNWNVELVLTVVSLSVHLSKR